MANKNTIDVRIEVRDNGTVTVNKFADNTQRAFRDVEGSAKTAGSGIDSAMTSVMGTMQKLAPVLASAFAVERMISFAKESTLAAARYETLGVVMTVVGNNLGYSGKQMEQFAEALQKNGISMSESRQSLTRMAQAQLDLSKSTELARVAQDAAVIGNINSSEAFQRMIYGIQSGQVEVLRTIGINVNFEESYKKVARQTGRTVESFTEAEKAQIRLSAALKSGEVTAGTYDAAMETAGKQLNSMTRHFENLKVLAGGAFTPALSEFVGTITGAVTDLNGKLSGEGKEAIATWGTNLRIGIISVQAEFMRVAMLIDKIGGSMTQAQMLLYGPGAAFGAESSRKRFEAAAQANIEYQKRYEDTSKALEGLAYKQIKLEESLTAAGKARAKAEADAAEQRRIANRNKKDEIKNAETEAQIRKNMLSVMTADNKSYYEDASARADHWLKMQKIGGNEDLASTIGAFDTKKIALNEWYDAQASAIQRYIQKESEKNKALSQLDQEYGKSWEKLKNDEAITIATMTKKAEDDAIKGMEKEIALGVKLSEESIKLSVERGKAARDLYKDMQGYHLEYYQESLKLINEQAARYRNDKLDEVAIAKWVAEEQQKAWIKMAEASDDWVNGVRAGFLQVQRDQVTWGKLMSQGVFKTYESMAKGFSDIVYDGITGDLKSIDNYAKSIGGSMVRSFTDAAGRMAAKPIIAYFETKWTENGASALGIIDKLLGYAGIDSNLGFTEPAMPDIPNYYSGAEQSFAGLPGFASGGHMPAGKPVWVGEKGPEILFSQSPGYVMNHEDSLSYAARNGGYIPGRAYGGPVGDITAINKTIAPYWDVPRYTAWDASGAEYAISGGSIYRTTPGESYLLPEYGVVQGGVSDTLAPAAIAALAAALSRYRGAISETLLPDLSGSGGFSGFMNNLSEQAYSNISNLTNDLGEIMGVISPMLIKAGTVAVMTAGIGGVLGGVYGAAGAGTAAASEGGITAAQLAAAAEAGKAAGELTALGISVGTPTGLTAFAAAAAQYLAENGPQMLLKQGLKTLFSKSIAASHDTGGGIDGLGLRFAGMSGGDFSFLRDLNGIVGKRYAFPLRDGLDFVPYDNFPALLHKGEAVKTAEEAERDRSGNDRPIIIMVELEGKILKKYLYDASKNGDKIVHVRGIADK